LEIATDWRSAGVTIAREQALDTIVAMVMSSLPKEIPRVVVMVLR